MKKAGAGVPSANRITLLRDSDGDGPVDSRSVFLQGLNSPFGMALVGNDFYVVDTDGVVRFDYRGADADTTGGDKMLACRPDPSTGTGPATLLHHQDGASFL